MKNRYPKTEKERPNGYTTKWNADVERPIRWLPMGHTLEEKLERIELLYEQVQVYRTWTLARKSVPPDQRTFFEEEVERLEAFLQTAI